MFYDRYVKLCTTKGKSPSAVAIELGIGKSTVSCWKRRGNSPTDAVLQKIADYFSIPVSELIEEQKEKPTQEGEPMNPILADIYKMLDGCSEEELNLAKARLQKIIESRGE